MSSIAVEAPSRRNSAAEAPQGLLRVGLAIDGRAPRRWHLDLCRRLGALPGVTVRIAPLEAGAGSAQTLPAGTQLLFQLETLVYGLPPIGAAAPVPPSDLAAWRAAGDAGGEDLTIDLTGAAPPAAGRRWTLTFDGIAGETGLLGLILAGRTPLAEIVEDGGRVVAAGRLGTEYGGITVAALEDVVSRASTLILAVLQGGQRPGLPALPAEPPMKAFARPGTKTVARLAGKQVARAVVRRLYRLCCHAPHWRTGWRRLDGPDLIDLRRHPLTGWHDLPDDGRRFYADPFPILHRGEVTLFVEEFPHATGRGLISAVAFGPDGPIGTPRPVLETAGHLSYPFVFERDGQVWMIPESCDAGTVDLYRATAFPGGWVKEATLIDGITASDATLLERDGRWWLFATVREGGGAFSDALHLWSAPDFRGPWTPHRANPVLIDIASARPAGRMVVRGGALIRPVQDCRRGYGAALGLARVTRLDDQAFEQTVETILTAGSLWPGRRLHTLNSAGGIEVIDGSGVAPRLPWRRRA